MQKDEFSTSDSGDEDEQPGLSPTELQTLRLCTPTGDTERLTAGQLEKVTSGKMTEDVETPRGDYVTEDPVLPDSEA